MIPIDGEKLVEWLDEYFIRLKKCEPDDEDDVIYHNGQVFMLDDLIFTIKNRIEEYNLQPGTLIIKREEGYESRECDDCIVMYCSCVDIDDTRRDMRPRSKEPCPYHTTESELKAAYIVGGGEK